MCISHRIAFLAILLGAYCCARLGAAPVAESNIPAGSRTASSAAQSGVPLRALSFLTFHTAPPVPSVESEHPTPADDEVILHAAVDEFRRGNIDQCRSHLRRAVVANPYLPPADLILAELYLDVGQPRQTHKILEKFAAANAKHPQLHLTFGRLALAEGRLTEALMHYEKMDEAGAPSDWGDAQVKGLARAIFEGKVQVAEQRASWNLAQSLLSQWVKQHPDDPMLRSRWARALVLAGDVRKGLEQFNVIYQQNNFSNRPETAVAAVYAQEGRFSEANRWFARALQSFQEDPRPHFAWSMALAFQDRWQEAEIHAAKAASLGVDSANLALLRGVIARALGKHVEAERYLSSILETSPEHREATYQLTMTLSAQPNETSRRRALTLARSAVANHPQSKSAQAALGVALIGMRRPDEAEDVLRDAAYQSYPEVLFIYGRLLVKNKKPESARRVAERLRERIGQPGVFVTRSAARKWIQVMLP